MSNPNGVSAEALQAALAAVEAAVADPRRGLPEPIFLAISRLIPLANVDLLIQDERRRTLLTWRDDAYFGRGWHLPGSVIRFQEALADRVRACARAEVGSDVTFDPQPLAVEELIGPPLATRGHCLGLLYRCRLAGPPDPARAWTSGPPAADQWAWHHGVPPDFLAVQRAYARFLSPRYHATVPEP